MSEPNKPKTTGIRRIWNALFYSIDGIRTTWKDEAALRQELVLALVLTIAACIIPFSLYMRIILISSMALVLIVELLNSAIEAIVDMVTEEFNPLAKKAKDCGSAAVLLSLLLAGGIWIAALYDLLFPVLE